MSVKVQTMSEIEKLWPILTLNSNHQAHGFTLGLWFMVLIVSLAVHCDDQLYSVCFVLLVLYSLSLAKLVNIK